MADHKHITPTPELIRQYLEGTLDDKTMHALEKQALDDPFLADALEGYAAYEPDQQPALADLQQRLENRVEEADRKRGGIIRRVDVRWAAAAAVLILLAVSSVFLLNRQTTAPDIAQERKTVPAPDAVQPAIVSDETLPDSPSASTAVPSSAAPAGNPVVPPPAAPATGKASPAKDFAVAEAETAKPAAAPVAAFDVPPAAPVIPPAADTRYSTNAGEAEEAKRYGYASASKAKKEQVIVLRGLPQKAAKTGAVPDSSLTDIAKHNFQEKIDTVRIGRLRTDTMSLAYRESQLARRKALAQGNKVEGVVTGAEAKHRNFYEENALRLISGKVTGENGEFLPGVAVKVQGSDKGAITDANGNFALKVDTALPVKLDFSSIGYISANVALAKTQNNVNVVLPASSQSLSESVVVGYGSGKKSAASFSPQPQNGKAAYDKYLQSKQTVYVKDLAAPVSGIVSVTFTVNPDNTLSGFQVQSTFHEEASKAAVSIIKTGPAWKPAARNRRSVTTVQVPVSLVKAP